MNLSSYDFINLLGRPHSDPDVTATLNNIGLKSQNIRLKRGEFSSAHGAPEFGVDVVFKNADEFYLTAEFPESALIFSTVFFFKEGCQGHKQFLGELPSNLKFGYSRKEAHKNLGAPEWSSPVLPIDRWLWNGLKLTIDFIEDENSINIISCSLPKKN